MIFNRRINMTNDNNIRAAKYIRVGSIEQLDGQLEDVHIPGRMDENRKDVLIYCRVAHDDDFVLEFQQKWLIDFAYDKGFYVKGIYRDIGCSLGHNPERLEAMLSDIEKDPVDYVLVRNIDRISRKAASVLKIVKRLKKKNVEVFCADEDQVFHPFEF